jgi:hypothetical protein
MVPTTIVTSFMFPPQRFEFFERLERFEPTKY